MIVSDEQARQITMDDVWRSIERAMLTREWQAGPPE